MKIDNDTLIKIRDFIMYPYMLQMVVQWNEQMNRTQHSLRDLYEAAGWQLHQKVMDDFIALKREFRDRKIKVWEGDHEEEVIRNHILVDGYQDKFAIMRETLKSEIRIRLGKYISEMKKGMK